VEEYLAAQVPAAGYAATPLQPLARLIHQRTDGNPLFMVTVVEQVLAQSVTDSACLETGQVSIPETIRQLIEQQGDAWRYKTSGYWMRPVWSGQNSRRRPWLPQSQTTS